MSNMVSDGEQKEYIVFRFSSNASGKTTDSRRTVLKKHVNKLEFDEISKPPNLTKLCS